MFDVGLLSFALSFPRWAAAWGLCRLVFHHLLLAGVWLLALGVLGRGAKKQRGYVRLMLGFWRWAFGVLVFWRFGVGLLALGFWRCVVGAWGFVCGLGCAFNVGYLALSVSHWAFGFSRCGGFPRL